jgi:cobalt/nickel transport system permease protein
MLLFAPLWAVHISDGVLTRFCSLGGFLAAGLLMFLGAWRVRDEEIPRIALMTAAFFVVSLVHVPVPGGPRTHLLLNGLVGVVLGPRAALAIPLALFLQAVQFGHGGISALGVNSVVMVVPALASWLLFRALNWHPLIRRRSVRSGLVLVSTFAFALSAVYAAALLWSNHSGEDLQLAPANALLLNPLTLSAAALIAVLAALWESRSANAPEFPLGLLIGEFSVLLTLFLNALALLFGGVADWQPLVLITFVVHLPLAVLEGVVLGFTVGAPPPPCARAPSSSPEPSPWPCPPRRRLTTSE